MKALILAAGLGTRLKPLSEKIPKALIPVVNRPLISYPVINLIKVGIKKIAIVIRPVDKVRFILALKDYPANFEFFYQLRPEGTLKAIESAKDFITKEDFLLSWCDTITPFDFRKIIQQHERFRPLATLCIGKTSNPSVSAQVIFEDNLVKKIVEKPKRMVSEYVASTPTILTPEIFGCMKEIKPSIEGEFHLADCLQYLIEQGKEVRFVILDTWRINVNSFEEIKQASELISKSQGL
jgi:dTDP-glucose pyrophosphorylase